MADTQDFSTDVGAALPFLRRYARALTGDQTTGDQYAAATLEAILEDREITQNSSTVRIGMFRVFHTLWNSSGAPVHENEVGLRHKAQMRLAKLTPNSREALLLNTVEDFNSGGVAEIMGISKSEAAELVDIARKEMADAVSGRIMIIEDEPIIAMDLEDLIANSGHRVTGVARTRDEAVALASREAPDLILADIQLADNSSGIDAVRDILEKQGNRPVIFITAFPERLLTGERPEPAFLISKPYTEEQVESAISQAMFFASTETLTD